MNIQLFEDWKINEDLFESKFHFNFDHKRYTIHQARTNPSKFGIKDKDGNWEIFVRNDIFDPKKFGMKSKDFLDWVQRGIKHFNILGEVTRNEVSDSEWKQLFNFELKHNKPINKKICILKMQCIKRNVKWQIGNRKKKADNIDEKNKTDVLLSKLVAVVKEKFGKIFPKEEDEILDWLHKNHIDLYDYAMVDDNWDNAMEWLSENLLIESDPSLAPPKKWFNKMHSRIKKQNTDNDDTTVNKIIGDIWYHKIGKKKRSEIRKREGKKYGPAVNESFSFLMTTAAIFFFLKFIKGFLKDHDELLSTKYIIWSTLSELKLSKDDIEIKKIDEEKYEFYFKGVDKFTVDIKNKNMLFSGYKYPLVLSDKNIMDFKKVIENIK